MKVKSIHGNITEWSDEEVKAFWEEQRALYPDMGYEDFIKWLQTGKDYE